MRKYIKFNKHQTSQLKAQPTPGHAINQSLRISKFKTLANITVEDFAHFVAQLSRQDRWDMINYIRDMQPPLGQPTLTGEAAAATSPLTEPAAAPTDDAVPENSAPAAETLEADAVDEENQ